MTAIVFDLDGTLIDSAPDIQAALNTALILQGAAPVSLAETRDFIGHGIPNLIARARAARDLAPSLQAPLEREMLRAYMAAPSQLTEVYAGVRDTLQALQKRGHPLGLCTNKAIAPTQRILQDLDLARYFDVVIGGDSLEHRKPHPAPLAAAFAPLGTPLLYVGDSEIDAEAAENFGVPFALFTQGYCHRPHDQLRQQFSFDDWAAFDANLTQLLSHT